MGDTLFTDSEGLELRTIEGEDDAVELIAGAGEIRLSRTSALKLGEALRRWANPASAPLAEGFLVYYQHEYADREGHIQPIPELGESNAEQEFTWHEVTVADVRARAQYIGQKVEALHDRSEGFARDDDHARAWISIFRLPEDVRVWKGYWDELAETPDEELTA